MEPRASRIESNPRHRRVALLAAGGLCALGLALHLALREPIGSGEEPWDPRHADRGAARAPEHLAALELEEPPSSNAPSRREEEASDAVGGSETGEGHDVPAEERVPAAPHASAAEPTPLDKSARPIPRSLLDQWEARRAAGIAIVDDSSPADLVLAGGADGASPLREPSRDEHAIRTDWQPGETWSVLTYYRNMAAPEGDAWSAPLTWEFEVTQRTSLRDEEVLEVKVELGGRQAGELAPAHFYITPDRRLVALRNTVREQGEERSIYVFFDEDPQAAASGHFSIVPFDLPAEGTRARLAPAGSRIYDPVSRDALAKFPEPSRWIGAGGSYLEIEFPNRIDGTAIRQLWSEDDLRWPIVSITPSRRSYRVRP